MNTPNTRYLPQLPEDYPEAESTALKLGFLPLLDCTPVIVAKELGFFDEVGIDVTLSKENSWGAIRDKVQFGILDAAPMPAGIVLASSARIGASIPMVTGMGLGVNGNAITASNSVWQDINKTDNSSDSSCAADRFKAYLRTVESLTVATVHTYSSHRFLLNEWLKCYQIDPENKIRQIVLPPSQMPTAMKEGKIDLFCAGEPWNSVASRMGVGQRLIDGKDIWADAPDKMLTVTRPWHDKNPNTHRRLIAAVLKACLWLENDQNLLSGFRLLTQKNYLSTVLDNHELLSGGHSFSPSVATRPKSSQAMWFIDHIAEQNPQNAFDSEEMIRSTYLFDVYKDVSKLMGLITPPSDQNEALFLCNASKMDS